MAMNLGEVEDALDLSSRNIENGIAELSFERGSGPLDVGDVMRIDSQSWWTNKPKKKISIMASDKEKVVDNGSNGVAVKRDQQAEIQQVTERMLENANVHA
jgi:hypothetical protein